MKKVLILILANLASILLCQRNSTEQIIQIFNEQNIQYEYSGSKFQINGPPNANISLTLENITIVDSINFASSLSINFEKLILRNVQVDVKSKSSENKILLSIGFQNSIVIYYLQLDNVKTNQSIINATLAQNITILSGFIKYSNLNQGFGLLGQVNTFRVNNLIVDIKTINSLNGNFFDLFMVQNFIMKDCIFGKDQKLQQNQKSEITNQNQNYTNFMKVYNDGKQKDDFFIEIENIQANFDNLNVRFLLINDGVAHKTYVRNSQFSHMKSLDSGGCFKILGRGLLEFTNSLFDSCQTDMFGGALYTNQLSITDEITVQNCKSKVGGGAFFGDQYHNKIDYNKVKFINNSATVSSQQYFICTSQPNDRKFYYCNLFEIDQFYELNAELVNTEYYQKKREISITHSDYDTEIKNFSVFTNLIYIIRFRVEYSCAENEFKKNCIVTEFNENQYIGNLYNFLSGNDQKLFQFMSYDLPNANYPYLLVSFTPQFDFLNSLNIYSQINLSFFSDSNTANWRRVRFNTLSTCERGMQQIFNLKQKEQQCKYCDIGSYSNQISNSCEICDQQTFDKCYADVSYLKQNVWRPYNSSYNDTYLCQLNQKSCNGDNRLGYGNELCSEGYIGAQCLTCDINGEFWNGESYGQQGYFKCINCSSLNNNNLFIYLSDCFIILTFFFTIISSFKRMRAQIYRKYLSLYMKKIYIGCSFIRQKQASVYVKILLFNLQLYLLTYYFVDFNKYDSSIHSNIYSFLNPLQSSGGVSYDCFLKQYFPSSESLGFIKLLISVISPLILNAVVLLLVAIYSWIRKKNHYILLTTSFLYSIIFVFQPSITQYCIESISCIQLSSSNSYLMIDTKINCNDQSWIYLMYAISIPALIIYVFAIPIVFFVYIYQNRKQLEKTKIILAYGFMYDEYKREFFYWQFIKLLLSILLSALVSFGKTHIVMCCLLYSGVLSLYSISIIYYKPFQQIFINKVEITSITLSILYFLSSICLQLEFNQGNQYDQKQLGKIISEVFYYLVLACQLIFYLYIIHKIIVSVFYLSVQKMQRYSLFQRVLRRFPQAKLQIYSKNLEDNFQRFRKVVKDAIRNKNLSYLDTLTEKSYNNDEIQCINYSKNIKNK
ncbi:hypothetical protein ABPG74_020242 [Tetrahymena malaccensis]